MTYDFKILIEMGWAALVAAAAVVGQLLIELDTVDNWETWAIAGATAAARAALAAAIAVFTKSQITSA